MQYMHVAPAQLQPGDTLYADMGQVVASVAPAGGPWGGVVVQWQQPWLPPAHYSGTGPNAIARVAVKRAN